MKRSTWFTIALPGLAGAAVAHRYRDTVRELDTALCAPPALSGRVVSVATSWGRVSYRLADGDPAMTAIVLLHGWGRTADSAWWPVIQSTSRPVVAIDLPGHGRSVLERRFTLGFAAEGVLAVLDHAGVDRPILVGHSMGGAAALTTILWAGPDRFSGFVALATSAYWAMPRQSAMLAAAPYVLGPKAPWTIRMERRDMHRIPEQSSRIAWEYAVRPDRQVLMDTALELRGFDARRWNELDLPPTTWVVTSRDGIIEPHHQRRSAEFFGARRVEIPCDHSAVIESPETVNRIIEAAAERPSGPLLLAV